jgi:hypothetical protein
MSTPPPPCSHLPNSTPGCIFAPHAAQPPAKAAHQAASQPPRLCNRLPQHHTRLLVNPPPLLHSHLPTSTLGYTPPPMLRSHLPASTAGGMSTPPCYTAICHNSTPDCMGTGMLQQHNHGVPFRDLQRSLAIGTDPGRQCRRCWERMCARVTPPPSNIQNSSKRRARGQQHFHHKTVA